MAYASKAGRARISSTNPQALAICDRCGMTYNHVDLQWQFDYAGAGLINKRILVCNPCYDTPQEQLRAIVLPSDPTPIMNARVQDWVAAETNYQTISKAPVYDPVTGIPIPSTTILTTEDGSPMTNQPYGQPVGLDQNAVMPLNGNVKYGVKLSPLSITADGTNTVRVTFSAVHNLHDNDQIAVEGLTNPLADGFFSISIATATAFTYQTYSAIPTAALLQGTTNMVTALVGLPYGYVKIPQVGP